MAESLDALRLEKLRQLRDLRIRADTIEAGVARYADDPAGFARDCIDWRGTGLADYQENALAALPEHRRVCVRGPHGFGKTITAAATILWFALTRESAGRDWKIVTTASAWRQLIHYLWQDLGPEDLLFRYRQPTGPVIPEIPDPDTLGRTDPNTEGRTYRHGTLTGYRPGGGRCDYCRGAHARYRALRRAAGQDKPGASRPPVRLTRSAGL